MRVFIGVIEYILSQGKIDAELLLFGPGRYIIMRIGLYIRVNTYSYARLFSEPAGHGIDHYKLRDRLHIKKEYFFL